MQVRGGREKQRQRPALVVATSLSLFCFDFASENGNWIPVNRVCLKGSRVSAIRYGFLRVRCQTFESSLIFTTFQPGFAFSAFSTAQEESGQLVLVTL